MQPRILLIDDRPDNLVSIEAILEPDGYRFIKANSGREALKILLNDHDFALILMDVQMPNLNGFETATLIYEREKLRHIPIIFITAHSYDDENIFKGYRTGAVDYIYKPINPEMLRAKVLVFVELYRKNQRLVMQEQKLISINKSLEAEINERKHSEEKIKALNLQLLQNIDRLEEANKELDRFAFMASHDLQEPLRKISTYTDRIFSRFGASLDEDGKRYFSRIQHATRRMQTLIHDIMTFSKISDEKKSFVKSDMNALVTEVLSEMEDVVVEKKAKIMVGDIPALYVNPGLIKPLFYNIIINAIKYCHKNVEPVIRIRAEESANHDEHSGASRNKYCRIFIEDNGIGFEQKYADQIFQMFKRLHSHNEYEGTGIGLALCKKIVEEHSGFISVKSQVNEGSTFIVSLPMKVQV